MTTINTKPIILGALVVAGAVTPITPQHRTKVRQAAEIETLRQHLSQASQPQPPVPAKVDPEELNCWG